MDEAKYIERNTIIKNVLGFMGKKVEMPDVEKVEYKSINHSYIKAFSFSWPYLAFTMTA